MELIRFFSGALGAGLLLVPCASGVMRAQTQPPGAEKLKFEVASVRENTSSDGKMMFGIQPGGRFTTVNVPLWDLIRQAYGLQRSQLVGGPDWMETARFDIVAKAEGDIARGAGPGGPPGPLSFMLQDLLEDRFKLRAHRETRELPIYVLLLARTDGKLGRVYVRRPPTAPASLLAVAWAHRRAVWLRANGRHAV